jgi:hypothetical protein
VLVWSRRRVWWVLSFFVELSSGLVLFIGGSRLSDLTCFFGLGVCVLLFPCVFSFSIVILIFFLFFQFHVLLKAFAGSAAFTCGPAISLHCEHRSIFYIKGLLALFEFKLFTDRPEEYHTISIPSRVSQSQYFVSSPRLNMPIPGPQGPHTLTASNG